MTEKCKHELEKGEKGWFTCTKCEKKFRGKEAEKIMREQQEEAKKTTEEPVVEVHSTTNGKGETIRFHRPDFTKRGEEIKSPEGKTKEVEVRELSTGKVTTGKVTTIECIDCGTERVIKVQDAFQVTRCVDCQKKYRSKKRAEKKKQKKTENEE